MVYQLNAFIASKRARTGEDEQADHANEQKNVSVSRKLPTNTLSDSLLLPKAERYISRTCTQWECRNAAQPVPGARKTWHTSP